MIWANALFSTTQPGLLNASDGHTQAPEITLSALTQPAAWPAVQFWKEGVVTALLALPDGSLLVGGAFVAVNNVPCRNLARLTPGGAWDAWWTPQVDGPVSCLAVQGEDLFLAGKFASVNGVPRAGLAKVHLSDGGTVDTGWDPCPTGRPRPEGACDRPPFAGLVSSMIVSGEHLIVGGCFESIGGCRRTSLAKLELSGTGRADPQWAPEPGRADSVAPSIWALRAWEDSVFVGGSFSSLGGLDRGGLAKVRLVGSGEADVVWDPGLNRWPGFDMIRALEVDGDELVVGGNAVSNAWVLRVSLLQAGIVQTNSIQPLASRLVAMTAVGDGLFVALEPGPDRPGTLLERLPAWQSRRPGSRLAGPAL